MAVQHNARNAPKEVTTSDQVARNYVTGYVCQFNAVLKVFEKDEPQRILIGQAK